MCRRLRYPSTARCRGDDVAAGLRLPGVRKGYSAGVCTTREFQGVRAEDCVALAEIHHCPGLIVVVLFDEVTV